MKHLLKRSISIYRDKGPIELLRAARRFVEHGSLRDELLGLLPATERVLRFWIRCGRMIYPTRFTDADPFKILWIDPDNITQDIPSTRVPMRFGKVYDGDWDLDRSSFVERRVYKSFESHFIDGTPWSETEYYRRKRERLRKGKSTRGCTTVEDLDDYFAGFDDLYHSMKNEGYKTQRELMKESPTKTAKKNLDAPTPGLNEIGICIGRDGELLRGYRGQHRLAIAKIADVDAVAVQVLVRHRRWQQLRDRMRKNPSSSVDREHPDLEALFPE